VLLWSPLALAAPTFTGDPADTALADMIWAAADECAGRPGRAATRVRLARELPIGSGVGGLALWDRRGLYEVHLAPDAAPILLAHELAHAWFSGSQSRALIEGQAELLASCVAARVEGVEARPFDAFAVTTQSVDLRAWSDAPLPDDVLTHTYGAATCLVRSAAEVLGEARVLAAPLDWPQLRRLLVVDPGPALLEVIDAGVEAQRTAFGDPDLDGVCTWVEQLRGADPWTPEQDVLPCAHPRLADQRGRCARGRRAACERAATLCGLPLAPAIPESAR
jgi:hypothetical protein